MDSAEVLLHPVRLRVVQALMGGRKLTTQQIAEELDDVSTATVYRHVRVLHGAGVVSVVAERRARGAVERTYALRAEAARVSADGGEVMSTQELAAMFRSFVALLLGDFDRYLAAGTPDPLRDGLGFSMASLNLSDEEFAAFGAELGRVYEAFAAHEPRADRHRRIFATVVMPERPVDQAPG